MPEHYTKHDMQYIGDWFASLGDYLLKLFAKSTDTTIRELAQNELKVREIRKYA